MKRLNKLILTTAVAVIIASCSDMGGKNAENGQETKAPAKEMVKVISLSNEEISRTIEYSSTLEPFEEIHLAPSTPGRIEEINAEIGDPVKKGQALVKMDDTQLIQSEIQLNNLKTDYSRMDKLKSAGSIAQQQFDQLETQFEVAKKNFEYLSDNNVIEAPFNGVISGRYFEPGEMYSGTPVATVGKAAILSIIQIDKLKAIVSISEKYFPMINKGMTAGVKADVYPEMDFSGKIVRIYPTINPQSRTFNVELTIDNSKNLLRPGMFCRVSIDLEKTEAMVLPVLAILKMQGSNIRYIFVEENGIAKRVEVQPGKRFDDKVEVISDELHVGDKIIISGQSRLIDQMEVQVVN